MPNENQKNPNQKQGQQPPTRREDEDQGQPVRRPDQPQPGNAPGGKQGEMGEEGDTGYDRGGRR